jgi:DMSO/TMAO reductase YedYZ molybdopterin-dependent catalytic subunit
MTRSTQTKTATRARGFERRVFLKGTAGATLGLTFVQAGCETNEVVTVGTGIEFDFVSPVDFDNTSLDPQAHNDPAFHFYQAGGRPYIADYDELPIFGPQDWSLEVSGDVNQPLNVGFEDLRTSYGEPLTLLKTLRCLFDDSRLPGLIGTALWTGVPVRRLVEAAGVDPMVVNRFRFFGRDGFTNNLLYGEVFDDAKEVWEEPILAWRMNGRDVPHAHGGPVRLIIPGKFGYKNIKWIERIEATADDSEFGTYQEQLGAFDAADVQPFTKATNPLNRQEIPAGTFQIFGFGVSGLAPVDRIEIEIDGAPWQEVDIIPLADLEQAYPQLSEAAQVQAAIPFPYRDVWALFRFEWEATPGPHRLRFRTVDTAGNMQPMTDGDGTDGQNAYFDIEVTAV